MAAIDQVIPSSSRVWDLPVRLFHWSLLATVTVAGVTGFLLPLTWLTLHLIAGSVLAALLLFRLVWGFSGSAYSRFSNFIFSPAVIIAYARDQLRGKAEHFVGHNPIGAVMIFALLACLVTLVLTGTLALGGTEKQGPFRALVSYASGRFALNLHQLAAWGLLALITGHVAGVIVESLRSGENLPLAMVTGRKKSAGGSSQLAARPVVTMIVIAVTAGTLAVPGYALWRLPPAGMPAAPMDESYVTECGDCHAVFHPSLRTAATWEQIMSGLDDHFGENASLGAEKTAYITAYLKDNAAEHWDTRAANVFRTNDAADPLAITATPFWRHRHRGIDPAVFKFKKVGTKSNCDACHGDASLGQFAPHAIHIPEENSE